MKPSVLRVAAACTFIGLVSAGLLFNNGFGTFSSFGVGSIAEICPLGALEVLLASKTMIPRVLIAFVGFVIFCLILGRVFCAWICPVPLLRKAAGQEPLSPIKEQTREKKKIEFIDRASVVNRKRAENAASNASPSVQKEEKSQKKETLSKTPFVVLAATLASAFAFGFPVFCLICPVGLSFALILGIWSMLAFNEPSWTLLLIGSFLIFEVVFLRKWCHSFCPLGALMSLLSFFNKTFRPQVGEGCLHKANGFDCHRCKEACPEGIDLTGDVSPMLFSRCTKCHACAQACPAHAISFPFLSGRKKQSKGAAVSQPLVIRHRSPQESARDFDATLIPITKKEAVLEANRCIDCGACESACPQKTPIREMMALVREEKFLKAGKLLLSPGAMPEICSRVCPRDRLCQSACPLGAKDGPIQIGALTGFCADYVLTRSAAPRKAHKKKGKAAIVGAGPAGLACADVLAREGVEVSVFDKNSEPGGLLLYGIPSFKLPKETLKQRIELYRKEGIIFELGKVIQSREEIEELRQKFDAVVWAAGASEPIRPQIEGVSAEGFLTSDVFLFKVNAAINGADSVPQSLSGKTVVILGGGDSAMDCARSAVRLSAAKVICVARKAMNQLSADKKELSRSLAEGVEILDRTHILALETDKSGRLDGVRIKQANQESRTIHADLVISAWGFRPKKVDGLLGLVSYREDGTILTDEHQYAGNGIYIAGDAALGADLVTDAVAQGRLAAEAIVGALGEAGAKAKSQDKAQSASLSGLSMEEGA